MDVKIEYIDDVNIKIRCDAGIAQEISDYFTFFVPGYKFMPKYRNKMWDGKIRLFNQFTCLLYVGLLSRAGKFCKTVDTNFDIPDQIQIDQHSNRRRSIAWIKNLTHRFHQVITRSKHSLMPFRKHRTLLLSQQQAVSLSSSICSSDTSTYPLSSWSQPPL
jgi:hypothetical protein